MKKSSGVVTMFLICTVAYTLLFHLIENRDIITSLYWTVITMATIGYGDITPTTTAGKLLAMAMAISGIAIYTAFASVIVDHITEKNIRRLQGLDSVKINGHIIIVGWNEATMEALKELKHNVDCEAVVISPHPIEHKCVVGDPTDKETLIKASINKARCMLISTGDDSKTILTILLAKKLNPNINIVAEAVKMESAELIRFAGADRVILSKGFAGRLLASAIFEESVVRFFEDVTTSAEGDDVFEIPAKEVAGKSVLQAMIELKEKYNYLLVGLVSNGEILINPSSDRVIKAEDRILVIGRRRQQD
jgi:voltage-gated potassium channel